MLRKKRRILQGRPKNWLSWKKNQDVDLETEITPDLIPGVVTNSGLFQGVYYIYL